jgi:hypothetical protein
MSGTGEFSPNACRRETSGKSDKIVLQKFYKIDRSSSSFDVELGFFSVPFQCFFADESGCANYVQKLAERIWKQLDFAQSISKCIVEVENCDPQCSFLSALEQLR